MKCSMQLFPLFIFQFFTPKKTFCEIQDIFFYVDMKRLHGSWCPLDEVKLGEGFFFMKASLFFLRAQ